MDVFHLQGSITLDTSGFSQKVQETKKGFAGIATAANTSKKSASEFRSDVMKMAQTFRKEGMSMSDAMKKAHATIDKSLYDLGKSAKKAGSSFKESSSGIDYFRNKISALDVALGNLISRGISGLASGLKSFAVNMVETSATVQAENAQFEATFGAVADVAEDAFDRVGESTNILSTRLRTVGTKAFAQFTGAGLDTADSMENMERYMNLAADAAAYYDISLEDADTRLRSFLRGNTEAGDMIGLFTSESQRNTYAMEKYGASWLNLTEAQKQMLMLDVAEDIYKQSGAMGQAAREGDAYENVMGNFRETIKQTIGVLGAPVQVAFTDFISKLTDFLNDDDLQDDLEKFSFVLGGIADTTFTNIESFLDYLATDEGKEVIKEKLQSISDFFGDVKDFFKSVFTEENIERVKNFASSLGSVYEKISEITGLTFGESYLLAKIGTPILSKVGAPLAKGVGTLATSVGGAAAIGGGITIATLLDGGWEAIVTDLSNALNIAGENITKNWNSWQDLVQSYVEAIDSAVDAVGNFFSITIPEAWTNAMNSIASWWGTITTGIDNAISSLKEFLGINGSSGSSTRVSYGESYGGGSGASFTAFDGTTGGPGGLRGYATGLPNVPYNNFVARLHEGERVLTKAENAAYSSRARGTGRESTNLAEAIAAAVVSAMSGMQVSMDGQRVGDIVTDRVSRNIAQAAYVGRFG